MYHPSTHGTGFWGFESLSPNLGDGGTVDAPVVPDISITSFLRRGI